MDAMKRTPLELPSERFYERLTSEENRLVRDTLTYLQEYMGSRSSAYLIAGVGGILRRQNSQLAKDIDLAVVGMKCAKP